MKTTFKHLLALGTLVSAFGASVAVAAPAAENFDNLCAKCHGADGKAQGKMGKKLKIRDMTTETYKKELDDAKAVAVLKDGITKDGKEIKKSFAGDLSEADMKALIAYVRELK